MTPYALRSLSAIFLLLLCMTAQAQAKKNTARPGRNYPASFRIQTSELDALLSRSPNSTITSRANRYLRRGVVVANTASGDMRFLKLKLDYFKNAFLTVQVNGSFSTQVFILSTDKSVFYKGSFEDGQLVMSACHEDDIVSE